MRIFLSGNEEAARWHLPIAQAKVREFVARTAKSGLNQNTFTFLFEDTGTRVFAQYSFGNVSMQVHSPVAKIEEPQPEEEKAPSVELVVAVGTEAAGYNVAVIPFGNGSTIYGRADTFSEITATLQPADQREHHLRRFSIKTDRDAYDSQEYLLENYAASGTINLFRETTPGAKCAPTIAARCPELPAAESEIYQCQELDEVTVAPLAYLLDASIEQQIAAGFTARAWCYGRNESTHRSYWAQKREVTYAATGSVNRLSFGADVFLERGETIPKAALSESLTTFYSLSADEYDCTTLWADDAVISQNSVVGYGALTVERVLTPAGPASVIRGGDMGERIHGFYNADEDALAYGHSEPFTASIESDVMDAMVAGNNAGSTSLYAYSDPAVFSTHGTTESSFFCPLTLFESVKLTPGMVNTFDGDNEDGLVTYSNIEAKNISLSAECNGLTYEVYFKNFLEAKFTRNASTGLFAKSDVGQVSIGACANPVGGTDSFLAKVDAAFAYFRERDIAEELITTDDATPVFGSVMCYLHDRTAQSSYLADEVALFELINGLRVGLELPPLAMNIDLCVAARFHAEDMAIHEYVGHIGHDGSTPGQRIDGTGFCGGAVQYLTIGENAGYGYDSPTEQFDGWRTSTDGHYEAMINPKFREIGIGLAVNDGVSYRCAVFAGDNDL